MLPLAELKPGQSLVGLEPNLVTVVVAVVPIAANPVQFVYRTRRSRRSSSSTRSRSRWSPSMWTGRRGTGCWTSST
jgi:hypothetical protein